MSDFNDFSWLIGELKGVFAGVVSKRGAAPAKLFFNKRCKHIALIDTSSAKTYMELMEERFFLGDIEER